MIPKKIHYIWFGRNPLPELALRCIESWKKYCPDYEIIEWNEDNFDISKNLYAKQAYEAKKWAFVSDYARLKILYEYGGIYMDTDVEVLKNLDIFLKHNAFSGFESNNSIPTGIMASVKNNQIINEFLRYYNNKSFILENGNFDTTTNVTIMTNILLKKGLVPNNSLQTICDFTLYPSEYFCPKDLETGDINLTKNSYTIHHFNGSWLSDTEKAIVSKKSYFIKQYGHKLGKIIYYLYFIFKNYQIYGLKQTVKILKHKYRTSLYYEGK